MPDSQNADPFEGRSGAVSLTFDDGTLNQLANAVPLLDEYGLKGTFYINPRPSVIHEYCDSWRAVASHGHEIGNHTLSHPCPSAITGGRGLEDMRLEEMERDIAEAQAQLATLAPHQTAWTFAYPCYSTYVGRGAKRRSYVPIIADHFLAGRAGGEIGFANRPGLLDIAALAATPVERLDASETVALIDRLTGDGQWLILVYHDVDGQVLSVPTEAFEFVLKHLARNSERILTATVAEVASKLVENRLTPV